MGNDYLLLNNWDKRSQESGVRSKKEELREMRNEGEMNNVK